MKKNIIENDFVMYWMEEEIVCVMYKENVLIGAEAAKEVIALRRKSFPGNHPYLVYLYTGMNCVTKEARKLFASDEATVGVTRGALLVKSIFNEVLGNAYLKIDKPKIPTALFRNKEEALKWLRKRE